VVSVSARTRHALRHGLELPAPQLVGAGKGNSQKSEKIISRQFAEPGRSPVGKSHPDVPLLLVSRRLADFMSPAKHFFYHIPTEPHPTEGAGGLNVIMESDPLVLRHVETPKIEIIEISGGTTRRPTLGTAAGAPRCAK